MKKTDEDAVFGFIVPAPESLRLETVASYMNKTPYQLILDSINRLYEAYEEQVM